MLSRFPVQGVAHIRDHRKVNTLILVHSRQLLDQWRERLQAFLPDTEIGVVGGGKKKPTFVIDIATYQSLINLKDNTVLPLVQDYRQVIVDECHHVSAPRFEMVLNEVRAKYVLVLTERREHAQTINKLLQEKGIKSVALTGAMKAAERKSTNEGLLTATVVVATGKYVGEGFDLPRLDTLFLAMPIAWKGALAQYAGRIHREVEGKTLVTIHDYVDCNFPMLQRMYAKRERSYKAMGYKMVATASEHRT